MRAVALLILIYTGITAHNILNAWQDDPFSFNGKYAFFVWLIPIAIHAFKQSKLKKTLEADPYFMALGILGCLTGSLVDLNFLKYAGFAAACIGLLPARWINLLLLIASTTWMPVWGWVGSHFFHLNIDPWRIPSAAGFILLFLLLTRHARHNQTA